ncbi:MAG: hypothetical protein JW993_19680 [Sedimentisphaerales bacterium]|nr:hypothetical protein [Sedimentisphaerales bacterium]
MMVAKCASATCVLSIVLAGLLLGESLPTVDSDPNGPQRKEGVVIELTRFEITPETLELCYDTRNDSNDDVWVCADIDDKVHLDFAVCLSDDGSALQVIRRPDLPPGGPDLAYEYSRFVRLHSGQARTEVLRLDLPIFAPRFSNGDRLTQNGLVARSLSLDVGCYADEVVEWARYSRTFRQTSEDEFLTHALSATEWPEELALVLQAHIEGVRIPLEVGDAASYPVYWDFFAQLYPQADPVVLKAETVWRHANADFVRDKLEGVREDTLRDFRRKNLASVPLEPDLIEDPNIVLVSEAQLAEILSEPDGWSLFGERYPDSPGLSQVSCVGFSDDHTQALLYAGTTRGRVGSGWVYLLEWNGSAWEIRDFVMVWVS